MSAPVLVAIDSTSEMNPTLYTDLYGGTALDNTILSCAGARREWEVYRRKVRAWPVGRHLALDRLDKSDGLMSWRVTIEPWTMGVCLKSPQGDLN